MRGLNTDFTPTFKVQRQERLQPRWGGGREGRALLRVGVRWARLGREARALLILHPP